MSSMTKLTALWAGMGARERTLSVVAGLLIVFGIGDLAIYEPYVASLSTLRREVEAAKKDLAAKIKQRQDLGAEVEALTAVKKEATSGKAYLAQASMAGHVWDEAQAADWTHYVVASYAPELVSMSVASQGSLGSGYHAVYAHPIEVALNGDWLKISKFMIDINQMKATELDHMEFVARDDGKVGFLLRMKLLSVEQTWADAREVSHE